jgi:sugar O-acyltransferase (sialic acid O-acetyltransferase NeuD family)
MLRGVNMHCSPFIDAAERIVIVGTGESAAFAFEYFSDDSAHEVVAFSAERSFQTADVYCGLPVVPLDELAGAYPPAGYRTFVAVSMTQLNRVRRRLYEAVKTAGYDCVSYISSRAFTMASAVVGENAFIQEHVALQHRARVGDNVFIGSGACIGHSSVIEDDCFVGPGAMVCGLSKVGRSCFVGAQSCIADGLSVAEDCIIGAGAVVLKDTAPRQVWLGNPARPVGRDSFEASREREHALQARATVPREAWSPSATQASAGLSI